MSFSTMNGIRAARTAGAARPQTQQNMGGQIPMPAGMPPSLTPRPATPLPGTGMMGTHAAAFQGMQAPPAANGFAQEKVNHAAYMAPRPDTGVRPGVQGPQLQGPAPTQFDPNDPENAALAGYMNGA